jgi:hypothetical protein
VARHYNFPSRAKLTASYECAGGWTSVVMEEAAGGGFDSVPRTFLHVTDVTA